MTGQQYEVIEAQIGDTLHFEYGVLHDVWSMSDGSCNFNALDSKMIGSYADSPVRYVLGKKGEFWFSCSTRGHCGSGQNVKVIVTDHEHPCEDDPDGLVAEFGIDCSSLLQFMDGDCENDISTKISFVPPGYTAASVCPVSCKVCDPEESTPTDKEVKLSPAEVALAANPGLCRPEICDLTKYDIGDGSVGKMIRPFAANCANPTSEQCGKFVGWLYACADYNSPMPKNVRYRIIFALQNFVERMFGLNTESSDPNLSGNFLDQFRASTLGGDAAPRRNRERTNGARNGDRDRNRFAVKDNDGGYCEEPVVDEDGVHSVTCFSLPIHMYPGAMLDFNTELVNPYPDQTIQIVENFGRVIRDGKEVRLDEVYVHHMVSNILDGAGAESVRAPQYEIPEPYVRLRFPYMNNNRFTNFHLINTVGVTEEDRLACIECWCDEGEVTNGSFGTDSRGNNGGVTCCKDCPTTAPPQNITYYFQYDVKYKLFDAEDDLPHVTPVHTTMYNAANAIEYDVDVAAGVDGVHTLTKVTTVDYPSPQDKAMKIFGCEGHQHIGGIGLEVVDDVTGEVICAITPRYGMGDALGDEKDYLVEMHGQSFFDAPKVFEPGHPIRVVSHYTTDVAHKGVMALVYVWYEGDKDKITEAVREADNPLKLRLPVCKETEEPQAKGEGGDELESMSNSWDSSDSFSGSFSDDLVSLVPPGPVRMLHAAERTADSVFLMWMTPLEHFDMCEDYSYRVQYKTVSKSSNTTRRTAMKAKITDSWKTAAMASPKDTGVRVSGLKARKQYEFRVVAVRPDGQEGEAEAIVASTRKK